MSTNKQPRVKVYPLRLSELEWLDLAARADSRGMTMADYFRRALTVTEALETLQAVGKLPADVLR